MAARPPAADCAARVRGRKAIPRSAGGASAPRPIFLSDPPGCRRLALAAAFCVVPIVVMSIYLTLARRAGAFDAL